MSGAVPTNLNVIGARRPLIDGQGQIAGFEFYVSESLRARIEARGDTMAHKAHLNNLLGSMHHCTQSGHLAYAELPASWMSIAPSGAIKGFELSLSELHTITDLAAFMRATDAWRKAGASIGWRLAEGRNLGMRPDFIICDKALPVEGLRWVAPNLPDVDTLESALRVGAAWAGSAVQIGTEPKELRALPPQARQLMRLLNRLVRDEETAVLVNDIKADAVLSVRLLQHINTAGMSRGATLDSIEQAVAVLGRDALYHWVSSLLVRMAPPRTAVAGLQARALWRGRMLEMMGRATGEPQPGSLYLMGLCSVLPLLLQISLKEALSTLQLPSLAEQALLLRQGPWAAYLRLMEAVELPDLKTAKLLAEPVGGLDVLMNMSSRAWVPE